MTNEEKIVEGGFRKCIAYAVELDSNTQSRLRRIATENRLIISEWSDDLEYVLFAGELAEDTEAVLVEKCSDLGEGYRYYWNVFLLGGRKLDIIIGEERERTEIDDLIEYFVKAEFETRIKRMTAGRKRMRQKGYHAGREPFGYYTDKRKLYVDPYESFIVKFIFYRRENGASYREIRDELNDRGYKTKEGHYFEDMTIYRIINKKKFYQGYSEYKGEYFKGQHPAILGEDELLTEEFKAKICDEITKKRFIAHRKRINEKAAPQKINANYYSYRRQEKIYREGRK